MNVPKTELEKISKEIKYFDIKDDNGNVWHCRSRPFEKGFMKVNKV